MSKSSILELNTLIKEGHFYGKSSMYRKIALISDIHGNMTAFQAVCDDLKKQKINEVWFLGDMFSPGPGALEQWKLFKSLEPSVCVRGNWDDLLVNGYKGRLSLEKPSRVFFSRLAEFIGMQLGSAIIDEIEHWPLHQLIDVNNLRFSCAHNLPFHNFGQKLYPTSSQTTFDEVLKDTKADVALYAHVHHPLMRYTTSEQLVINPGSVGEPFCDWPGLHDDLRAEYCILECDEQGMPQVSFRKVSYDRQKEIRRAENAGLPYLDLYSDQLYSGIVHTHDHDLLEKINEERGYLKDVLKYIEKLK